MTIQFSNSLCPNDLETTMDSNALLKRNVACTALSTSVSLMRRLEHVHQNNISSQAPSAFTAPQGSLTATARMKSGLEVVGFTILPLNFFQKKPNPDVIIADSASGRNGR